MGGRWLAVAERPRTVAEQSVDPLTGTASVHGSWGGEDLGVRLRLSAGLGLAGAAGAAAAMPYALQLQGASLGAVAAKAEMSPMALLAIGFGQGFVICLMLSWFASAWAPKLGFGMPVFGEWAAGRAGKLPGSHAAVGLGTGLLAGGGVLTFALLFGPDALAPLCDRTPGPLAGLAASLYGGVTEEIIARFFLLTGVTALVRGRADDGEGRQSLRFWIANVLVAVLFWAGHLPTLVAAGVPLDPAVGSYLLVANGGVSLALGWLYGRYGLETAMLGHFTADILLHVLATMFG